MDRLTAAKKIRALPAASVMMETVCRNGNVVTYRDGDSYCVISCCANSGLVTDLGAKTAEKKHLELVEWLGGAKPPPVSPDLYISGY